MQAVTRLRQLQQQLVSDCCSVLGDASYFERVKLYVRLADQLDKHEVAA